MLVFSRDTWMIDQFKHFANKPPKSFVRGNKTFYALVYKSFLRSFLFEVDQVRY